MLNENAKKWVAALRSGEYKQTRRALRDDYGFCCLGVACDLYGREKGVAWTDGLFLGQGGMIPDPVINYLGGKPERFYVFTHLATMNDSGISFNEIADYIESEPEGMFEEEII